MTDRTSPAADAWSPWRRTTPARIGLGRVGDAAPTAELLRFGWAHASARDAIHARPDLDLLEATLKAQGWQPVRVKSRAPDRATYLRRPDLGRLLDEEDAKQLQAVPGGCDVCIVVGDGLSALAIEVVSFDSDGIIGQRLAVELGALPAGKTLVRLFGIPETSCDRLAQLLLNEAVECRTAAGPLPDCLALLRPSSRASATFTK